MHVDHILPEIEGGPTTIDNLCSICFSCNVSKGAKQTGKDPETTQEVSLFHPLRSRWQEHFG